jgi:hypothetical protein
VSPTYLLLVGPTATCKSSNGPVVAKFKFDSFTHARPHPRTHVRTQNGKNVESTFSKADLVFPEKKDFREREGGEEGVQPAMERDWCMGCGSNLEAGCVFVWQNDACAWILLWDVVAPGMSSLGVCNISMELLQRPCDLGVKGIASPKG